MSKEGLKKLNEELLEHFKQTGVTDAFYYEPFFDYYWDQKHKIGLCNLEPYDTRFKGINKVTDELIMDYWSGAPTIQKSLIIFRAITWLLDNGIDIDENTVKSFADIKKDWQKVVEEDLGCSLYFNLRLTTGNQVNADEKAINEFYNDPFYADYFRRFVKETELDMLIVTSKIGVNIVNKIYPDLNLAWGEKREAKFYDGVLFCPTEHPSRESYKKIADDLNYFFDVYFKNKKN